MMKRDTVLWVGLTILLITLMGINPVWGQESERLNINTASAKELAGLQNVGPKYAVRIIEHRQKYGPFKLTEELMDVPGIGLRTFDRIKDQIIAQ
ncbi:MAG: ComEA family DNA-binding protein [Desulfobacterales bacterium]|nr:ComEA family DNA-binding protein [Desulfobacterales bacterium]